MARLVQTVSGSSEPPNGAPEKGGAFRLPTGLGLCPHILSSLRWRSRGKRWREAERSRRFSCLHSALCSNVSGATRFRAISGSTPR